MSADFRGINSGERVDSYSERYLWVIAGAVLTGLFLRVRGAAGDLWLDEIWTLRLIGPATSLSDIFLRIPHDNNHYLNSAWLFAVGPEASTLAMRAASVVLGCLSVIAAAYATAKQGRAASVLAAALFATSYFFVHYGSEARGYSGMILCILSAKAALDSLMEDRPPLLAWWIFFAAVCLGVFFHLTMVEASGALACAALAQTLDEGRLRRGVLIAAGGALACFPALGCFIYGTFSPQFGVGAMGPFTYDAMLRGLSGAACAALGLPADMGDWLCILLTALAAAGALSLLPRSRRWFPIAAIFLLPALHAAAQLPNQFYPRFHMTAAVGLLLLASEALAALLMRGGISRALSIAALGFFAISQTVALSNFYRDSRGDYSAAVRYMTANGPVSFTADQWKGEIAAVANYTAKRLGAPLAYAKYEDLCTSPSDWFIELTTLDNPTEPAVERRISPLTGACQMKFVRTAVFRSWGLSGYNWWVYRRAG